MSDALLGSLISGVVALAVAIITNQTSRKKDAIANAVRDQKIEDSINGLSKRVDAHNQLSDRIVSIEKAIVRIDAKMESLHQAKK